MVINNVLIIKSTCLCAWVSLVTFCLFTELLGLNYEIIIIATFIAILCSFVRFLGHPINEMFNTAIEMRSAYFLHPIELQRVVYHSNIKKIENQLILTNLILSLDINPLPTDRFSFTVAGLDSIVEDHL